MPSATQRPCSCREDELEIAPVRQNPQSVSLSDSRMRRCGLLDAPAAFSESHYRCSSASFPVGSRRHHRIQHTSRRAVVTRGRRRCDSRTDATTDALGEGYRSRRAPDRSNTGIVRGRLEPEVRHHFVYLLETQPVQLRGRGSLPRVDVRSFSGESRRIGRLVQPVGSRRQCGAPSLRSMPCRGEQRSVLPESVRPGSGGNPVRRSNETTITCGGWRRVQSVTSD